MDAERPPPSPRDGEPQPFPTRSSGLPEVPTRPPIWRGARGRAFVLVVVLAVAVGTAVAGLAWPEGGDGRVEAHGIAFEYPAAWTRGVETDFAADTGGEEFRETVGIDRRNLVFVAAYHVAVAVTSDTIGDVRDDIALAVEALVEGAGGTVEDGPRPVVVDRLPGYSFEATVRRTDGMVVRERLFAFFEGTRQYFVNCAYTDEHAQEVRRGCDQLIDTFEVTETGR